MLHSFVSCRSFCALFFSRSELSTFIGPFLSPFSLSLPPLFPLCFSLPLLYISFLLMPHSSAFVLPIFLNLISLPFSRSSLWAHGCTKVAFTDQWSNMTYTVEATLLSDLKGVTLVLPWLMLMGNRQGHSSDGLYDAYLVIDSESRCPFLEIGSPHLAPTVCWSPLRWRTLPSSHNPSLPTLPLPLPATPWLLRCSGRGRPGWRGGRGPSAQQVKGEVPPDPHLGVLVLANLGHGPSMAFG